MGQPKDGLEQDVNAYIYENGNYLTGTTQNSDNIDGAWNQTPFTAWQEILKARTGTIDLRIGPDGGSLPDKYYTYNVTVR